MQENLVSEEFLDTYEGEVLFLSQDLEELIEEIKSESFSQESIELLEEKLNEVSDVFLSSTYTQHVSPVFKELAHYVHEIEVTTFKMYPEANTLLCEIISDVNTYINFYFVDRIFSDVYLFQDSLKNSIEFLKHSFKCEVGECDEDDGSELDFF